MNQTRWNPIGSFTAVFAIILCTGAFLSPDAHSQSTVTPLIKQDLSSLNVKELKERSKTTKMGTKLLMMMDAYEKMLPSQTMADIMPLADEFLLMRDGMVGLQIAATDVQGCLTSLGNKGMKHISHYKHMINCFAPIDQLDKLKGMDDVRSVQLALKPWTNIGAATSQGDIAQKSDVTRLSYMVDGAGNKIGVLSDSYDALGGAASGIVTGDIPGPGNPNGYTLPVEVLDDVTGTSDEGRAMIEIIHDVAPGAEQAFHTAFNGYGDFAQGVLDLQAAGCNIIVDDILYFIEPYYSPGLVSQAVEIVCGLGAMYFSSAGNSDRESYEGIYDGSCGVDIGMDTLFGFPSYQNAHCFAPGDSMLSVTFSPGFYTVIFQWDEPFFSTTGNPAAAAAEDLDLGVYQDGQFLFGSFALNAFLTGDAFEGVQFSVGGTESTTLDFHIPFFFGFGPGPNRIKMIVYGGNVEDWEYGGDAPTIVGHANTPGACAVGASAWFFTPKFGVDPPGLNSFSSWGGVPIVFDAAGTPIPAEIYNKPEFVAPDGGNNTFFGNDTGRDPDVLPNFFGTSAAAPHAAAAAALLFEVGAADKNAVKTMLETTAQDMLTPGFDFGSGAGLIRVPRAMSMALGANASPNCRDLNTSVQPDGFARINLAELIVNTATGVGDLEVLIETDWGGRLYYYNGHVATDVVTITDACALTGQQLKVTISNSLGTCWSYVTLKNVSNPFIPSRNATVYCDDPLVAGGAIGGVPPAPLFACEDVSPATHVADWVTPYPCEPGVQDTVKVIVREWEAFDKRDRRGVGFDTIVVLQFPEIDARHIYCAEKDTVYCADTLQNIGPFITYDSLNTGVCDTSYLIHIEDLDDDGMLEFVANEFESKCGLNVHVDYWKFGGSCDIQYKVVVELKQTCYGLIQSTCAVMPPAGTMPNNAQLIAPGYWRCEFWVSDLDTLDPIVEAKDEDWNVAYTSEHECAAHTYVPTVTIDDDWSGIKQVKAVIKDVGSAVMTYNAENECWEAHTQFKLNKRERPYTVVYEAYDSCHNIGYDSVLIHIKDNVRPVAVVDKGVTVSLSDKKVWVDAATFDEGSWDNCGVNLFMVRRADWYEACIDLCDGPIDTCWIGEHHDTIWGVSLETDKDVDPVEAHYAKTLEWLCEDGTPCGDIIYNAWMYDLLKYGTKTCREHPYDLTNAQFRKLVDEAWYEGLQEKFKGGYLLGSGRNNWEMVKIDHQSGQGISIGQFYNDGSNPYPDIQYDPTLKKLYGNLDGEYLIQLDPLSGSALRKVEIDEYYPGMEFVGHTLYLTEDENPSNLVTIDVTTGDTTIIGNIGYGPISGLAYDKVSEVMYGITAGGAVADLLKIDLNTGAGTVVGSTGLAGLGGLEFGPDGKLYAAGVVFGDAAMALVTIDKDTAGHQMVGDIGYPITGLTLVAGDETVNEKLDLYEQIGGGWSDQVVFSCEDACGPVTVEILVMDYWCNWTKAWTNVWVEDKTPVTVAKDVIDEESISCKTYKDKRYTYPEEIHPVSLDYVVEQAKLGEQDAFDLLDDVFGGYCKAWMDPYGNYVDGEGAEIECDITFYDSICECTTYNKEVRVYDEHLGYIWKDSVVTDCYYYQDTLDFQKGIVVVNCEENVHCEQEVWCEFDHCGQGYIFRKFKIWQGCPDSFYLDHNVPDSLKHPVDTIYRHQRIWVQNTCDLDKYMFDVPYDTTVYSCNIEYDGANNVIGDAGPENTGYATYKFDDDCRLVGIGHVDKVFKVVGGDAACYKIIRTWYFADWCGTGGTPLDGNWWYDHELVTDSCVQKIIVIDTMPPVCVITGPVEDGGAIEVGACAFNLEVSVSAADPCGLSNYYWELKDISDPENTTVVDDGVGNLSSDEDDFDIESDDLPHGTYKLKVVTVDECNNEGYCEYVFDVVSVKKPSPVCVTSLTARLTPWDSDGDGVADTAKAVIWAGEFDSSSEPACQDTAIELRIEFITNDSTDESAAGDVDSLALGCNDAGTHFVRLWVVSLPSDTRDYCDVVLIVQSDFDGCDNSIGEREPLSEVTGMSEEEKEMDRDMLTSDKNKVVGVGGRPVVQNIVTSQYELQQNVPNPFQVETNIGFVLPSAMEATITIYDVTGRVLRTVEGDYAKGYNQVQFRDTDLGVSGVLYYRLNAGEFTATRKMILIE